MNYGRIRQKLKEKQKELSALKGKDRVKAEEKLIKEAQEGGDVRQESKKEKKEEVKEEKKEVEKEEKPKRRGRPRGTKSRRQA